MFLGNFTRESQRLKGTLESIFLESHYHKLWEDINQLLRIFNTMVVEALPKRLMKAWEKSEASFPAFLKNLEAGEEAEDLGRMLEKEIQELLNRGIPPFEFLPLVNTETPEMAEEVFRCAEESFQGFYQVVEGLRSEFNLAMQQYAEDNELFRALHPLSIYII